MNSSAAFRNMTYIATMNPSTGFPSSIEGTGSDDLSMRANYAEATLFSLACTVYNLVFLLGLGIAAAITCFSCPYINYSCKKFLIITGLSAMSIGNAAIGICCPNEAAIRTAALGKKVVDNIDSILGFLGNSQ